MEINELNESEHSWLSAHLQVARTLVQTYAIGPSDGSLTPESLETAWRAWILTSASQVDMANTIVNATGAAFGQFLVESEAFRWVVASDNHGTEMAVIALEGTGDVVVYPMNLVAKRYEAKETDFVVPLLEAIRSQVANARQAGGKQ